MLKAELAEIIHNGENSGIEFKRDDVHPDSLAREISALLNLEGGRILLGVRGRWIRDRPQPPPPGSRKMGHGSMQNPSGSIRHSILGNC
jgi:hypothetical protein